MKTVASFLKQTIIGAIWFLIPLVVLVVVLSKAHEFAGRIIRPLADLIPTHSIVGVGLARMLALITLILFCFLAAVFSKTRMAKKLIDFLETGFLEKLPGYWFLKNIITSGVWNEMPNTNGITIAKPSHSFKRKSGSMLIQS